MKQDTDIKSGPARKNPSMNIFARLLTGVMAHKNVISGRSTGGAINNKKKFDPVHRKVRNRIAVLSRRRNRR